MSSARPSLKDAKTYVRNHPSYDVDTVEVNDAGEVTALLDPDKRPGLSSEQRAVRYLVCHIEDLP